MRAPTVPVVLAAVLLASGCGAASGEDAEEVAGVATSAPDARLTLVADDDPVAAAASASRALFDTADVVVVARDGDAAGTLLGASAATGLGVPLLLEPSGGGAADALTGELERLGTTTVLTVGAAEGGSGEGVGGEGVPVVVAVPADPDAVAGATGLELGEVRQVDDGAATAAVAELDPEQPAALQPAGAAPAAGGEDAGELPAVERAEPLEDTLVVTTGDPEALAGVATARAAGARVQLTGGGTDPRGSAELVELMAEQEPQTVVALGAGFAAEEGLDWKLDAAATGAQLPGGGQLLFPGRMMIALYGSTEGAALGVLGEQDLEASIERARSTAAPYEELVDTPVVPAFEIIVTVASSVAGPDGNYSTEQPVEAVRPWVEAAGEAGLYVVLDLQPGRTDFRTQAEQYRSLLELPYVGLALDPEWRLRPDQVHLQQIGQVSIDEVNEVVSWLADLTRANELPQKLLVLHQFQVRMIPERERLDTSRDELAIMVHVDGQGPQPAKQDTWRVLRQTEPDEVAWGWKNFYDEDVPMLTPEQTVAVEPRPDFVSYQ